MIKINIHLNKNSKIPLYIQMSEQIKELILSGKLPKGSTLPSERAMAGITGVHRNTVVKAYAMLKDSELVDSIQGSAHVVTLGDVIQNSIISSSDGTKTKPKGEKKPRNVNWRHLIKDEYQDVDKVFDQGYTKALRNKGISFSGGLPPKIYPEEYIENAIMEILRDSGKKGSFIPPYQGDETLIGQILSFLRTKGIKVGKSQIQILSETNQALDFIAMSILKPGDWIFLEEPLSPDVHRIFSLAGCKILTIPRDDQGMICKDLEVLVSEYKPKLIYINSSFQDPTGTLLSLERRQKIVSIGKKYGVAIIEEDAASELTFGNEFVPTIKSMDEGGNVIYIYSFSISFVPGFSLAFVVGNHRLISTLSYLVSVRMTNMGLLNQRLISKVLQDGSYYVYTKEMAKINEIKMNIMCDELEHLREYGATFTRPNGGIYVWLALPENLSAKEVVKACKDKGLWLFPGNIFYLEPQRGGGFLRLNFSYESEEKIRAGSKILVETIKDLAIKEYK